MAAAPSVPDLEGWHRPDPLARVWGAMCAPTAWAAVPRGAGNGGSGATGNPRGCLRWPRSARLVLLAATPGGEPCWAQDPAWERGSQQHQAPLFPLAPTQSLLNPHPPSRCFQSPSGLASGHLFFMSAGRRWRSMAGRGSPGRRCCPWAGWLGQSRAAPQPLPFPPAPKCSCDANVGPRARAASKTIALRVLVFV